MFEQSKWIWPKNGDKTINEYAEFSFDFYPKTENPVFTISAISDYALFLNGKLVGFHQFPDFSDKKAYDSYSLKDFIKSGKNVFALQALSKDYDCCNHVKNGKGVIFEIREDEEVVLVSNKDVPSRLSTTYESGETYFITVQLGMSFCYDFNGEDGFFNENFDRENALVKFEQSLEIDRSTAFFERPIKRLVVENKIPFKKIRDGLYDLGAETSGYLYFDISSKKRQEITLSYGEHIVDGTVRRKIDARDFSVKFILKEGDNRFIAHFLRFGARYIAFDDSALTVNEIGLKEAVYPHKIVPYTDGKIPKEIYDTSVKTLECCMHDYFEDCPWREQGQYSMDGRNQMLCAYYAFRETEILASSLRSLTHRLTSKNVFPITAPCSTDLSIPSFSMVLPLMVWEYYTFTGDKTLLFDVYNNLKIMVNHYKDEAIGGLLPMQNEWNFFEWEQGLDDYIGENKTVRKEFVALPLNAFLIIALENFAKISKAIDEDFSVYEKEAARIKILARKTFLSDDGLFYTYVDGDKKYHFAEYTQTLALYSGIAKEEDKAYLLKVLTNENDLVPLTLSSHIYKYEVLLNEGGYEDYIIADIVKKWGYMSISGATTYWETIKGDADFDNAGSLCHGWSAVPIFVAWKLKK